MKTRTLFIGTGDFAVPILEKLMAMPEVELVGVVTQPDKPVGRNQELKGGPVKERWTAMVSNSPQWKAVGVYQPQKLKTEAEQILVETQPDLIIVAAYGQMIPQEMLDYPKYSCLNIHGSLLPQLRGAVPVQMAMLQGLEVTGVTIQKMVMELDAGPALARQELRIKNGECSGDLMGRMAVLGADLLAETLPKWVAEGITPTEQDHTLATFCYQSDVAKEKAEIKFDTPVAVAERMVRAFNPWPIAWFTIGGKRVKVFQANQCEEFRMKNGELSQAEGSENEGEELGIRREGKRLFLMLADGSLELLELQLEGKKKGSAADYLFLVNN